MMQLWCATKQLWFLLAINFINRLLHSNGMQVYISGGQHHNN
jgi:hypothetical protein